MAAASSSVPTPDTSALASAPFRLRRADGPTDVDVEVTEAPLRIGAGPRCDVRVDGPGLSPLHCIVTATADRCVVRRWAPNTWVNDQEFTEQTLEFGDRLRIGEIVFQVHPGFEPFDEPLADALLDAAPGDAEPPVFDPSLAADQPPAAEETEAAGDWGRGLADPPSDPAAEAASPAGKEPARKEPAESLANSPPAPKTAADAVADPAIPARLLQPWSPVTAEEGSRPATSNDADAAIADADADSDPGTDIDVDIDWDIDSEATEDSREALTDFYDASAADAFSAETADIASETEERPQVPAVAPAAVAPVADQDACSLETDADASDAVQHGSAAPPADPSAESAADSHALQDRLANTRARVRKLLSVLRDERSTWAVERADYALRQETTESTLQIVTNELEQALENLERTTVELSDATTRSNELAACLDEANTRLAAAEQQYAELAEEFAKAQESVAAAPADEVASFDVADASNAADAVETPVVGEVDATTAGETPTDRLESPTDPSSIEAPVNDVPVGDVPVAALVAEGAGVTASDGFEPSPETAPVAEYESAAEAPLDAADSGAQLTGEIDGLWAVERDAEGVVASAPAAPAATEEDPAPEFEPGVAAAEPASEPRGEEAVEHDAIEAPVVDTPSAAPPVESTPIESLWGADEPTDAAHQGSTTAFDAAETPAEPHEPESFYEKFAHTLPDDDVVPEPAAALPPAPMPEPEAPAEAGDDESLEDYMQRMMQRLRGEESPAAPAPQPVAKPVVAARVAKAPPAPEPAAPAPEPVKRLENLEELKRGPAPEHGHDMGALRQLANQSARQAIDLSAVNKTKEHASLRLIFAIISMVGGAVVCLLSPELLDVATLTGAAAMAVGGYFLYRTYSTGVAKHDEEDDGSDDEGA
ncbi:MAG: FHA domain-containing protein [Planctomycetota bacterium]